MTCAHPQCPIPDGLHEPNGWGESCITHGDNVSFCEMPPPEPTQPSTPAANLFAQPAPLTPSPLNDLFMEAARRTRLRARLVSEFNVPGSLAKVNPLRVDFAIPTSRIAIEIDGYEFHANTKDRFTAHIRRHRTLELLGWRVIRFTGQEVYGNAEHCAREAERLVALIERRTK